MKKVSFIIIIGICFITTVSALSSKFKFDSSQISFSANNKNNSVVNKFNKNYNLSHSIENKNMKIEDEIKQLTKKTTYLLLGDFNNQKESNENYYKRKKDFYDMGAYNYFPRDKNSSSGYDETNSLYRYVSASELAIPQLFNKFNELGIIYNSYGDIRVTISGDLIVSTVTLKDIEIKKEDQDDPIKYKNEKTNLIITYYFIKIDEKYRLTYLYGETTDNVNKYFNELEDSETALHAISTSYESNFSNIYNFDKVNQLTEQQLNNIYEINKENIVYIRSYYNNKIVSNANGVFINNGVILTTWSFLENSLINAQYLTLKDNLGKTYNIDGIITANPETDVALIKTKERNESTVVLGDNDSLLIENPAITLSSKSGTGLTIQKGIIISSENYIQTTIPLTQNDEGSPLFNTYGQLIGLNTSKSINSNTSIAINIDVIKEIKNKFNDIDFNSIKTISFESLKKDYYYTKYNKEKIVNSIPNRKWKKYSKIGDIEKNINLKLIKASYKDGIVSLRYKNNISKYISSMQLAVSFKEQLIEEGYKEILNSTSKCIYENNNYKVIITDAFDYLIVVMVRL